MCLGIPGRIIEIVDESDKLALADFGGVRRKVNVICVAGDDTSLDDLVGSWVLVHVGFAMSVIDEREAAATLAILNELGELESEVASMRQAAEP
jgi:hydrogenase expression/formation protein HypC